MDFEGGSDIERNAAAGGYRLAGKFPTGRQALQGAVGNYSRLCRKVKAAGVQCIEGLKYTGRPILNLLAGNCNRRCRGVKFSVHVELVVVSLALC